MAVKASDTVTLVRVVDVASVWRYYFLSTSMNKPVIDNPSVRPPKTGGVAWSTSEPAYTGGTYYLYFVDCTVFNNNTLSYSEVSLSSSYEAAKAAYNLANNANDTAIKAKTYTAKSTSAEGTASKVATISPVVSLSLIAGTTVTVTFTNGNTAVAPTLNVNSTGAKKIMTNGVNFAFWTANTTVLFVYDGTYWQVASTPVYASTVTIGNSSGRNIYMNDSTISIRNGSTALTTFGSNEIHLGLNSENSKIYLCGDKGHIEYSDILGLTMTSDSELGFYSDIPLAEEGYYKMFHMFGSAGEYSGIKLSNDDTEYTAELYMQTNSQWGEWDAPLDVKLSAESSESRAYIQLQCAGGTKDVGIYMNADHIDLTASNYINANSLTLQGHSSPIGTIITINGGTDYTTDLSSGTETWKNIASVTIPEGVWAIYYRVRYQNSSSGAHVIRTYMTSNSSSSTFSDTQNGTATNYLVSSHTTIVSVSSETKYYLRGYASVAGTWFRGTSAELRIVAVRLV